MDGQTLSYNGGTPAAKQFTWQGSTAHEARASVKFGSGPDLVWSNDQGTWAPFRFFDKADRWQPADPGYSLEWTIRIGKDAVTLPSGKPLTVRFDLDTAGMPPIFQRGYLAKAACVGEIAQ
jgi:type VI protein secretion system component VasK